MPATETMMPAAQSAEFAKCECCRLTEECTTAYIAQVRERYRGYWICGLCTEAVKDEIHRSARFISNEEALERHMIFSRDFLFRAFVRPPVESEQLAYNWFTSRGLPHLGMSEKLSRNTEDAQFLEQLLAYSHIHDYKLPIDIKMISQRCFLSRALCQVAQLVHETLKGVSLKFDEEWVPDEDEREVLQDITNNTKLSEGYLNLAHDIEVMEPKSPADIYKAHLIDGRASASSSLDSARQNLASTFMNAFVNAGFG